MQSKGLSKTHEIRIETNKSDATEKTLHEAHNQCSDSSSRDRIELGTALISFGTAVSLFGTCRNKHFRKQTAGKQQKPVQTC